MGSTSTTTGKELGWRCPSCGRAFKRAGQQHSCRSVALEDHLGPEHPMRPVFDHIVRVVERDLGPCEVVSLPCCIHLAGRYGFAAVLPRKRHLEIRFSLRRRLEDPRIERSESTGASTWKHSVHVTTEQDVDAVLLGWLGEAYSLDDV